MVAAIASSLEAGFLMIAAGLNEAHWALSKQEAVMLARAIENYFDKLPHSQWKKLEMMAKKYFPLYNLVITTSIIIYPRIMKSIQIRQGKYEEKINQSNIEDSIAN